MSQDLDDPDLPVRTAIWSILKDNKKRQDQIDKLAEMFEARMDAAIEVPLSIRTGIPGPAATYEEIAPGIEIGRNGAGSIVTLEIDGGVARD